MSHVSTHTDHLDQFNQHVQALMSKDPAFRDRFERATARSVGAALRAAGEPALDEEAFVANLRNPVSARGGITFHGYFWGFQLEIPHNDLQNFTNDTGAITQIIAAVAGSAPWVALVAGFIAASLAVLRALDHGRGIMISMSWFALGVFVPTSL